MKQSSTSDQRFHG